MTPSVLWFRRDLRLADHPALCAAAAAGEVLPVFVVDPVLWRPAGPVRRAMLTRSLQALSTATDGALVLRHGDPAEVIPELLTRAGAQQVHVSADAGPYGRDRDARVAAALTAAGAALVATGTPYAIGPGTLLNGSGTPYRVFTPFRNAWLDHGWPRPAAVPEPPVRWLDAPSDPMPSATEIGDLAGVELPEAGEAAAQRTWAQFRDGALADYHETRDLAATAGTSRLSAHLKFGEIHPRTLLADLADLDAGPGAAGGAGAQKFRAELCWREFYADVMWHHPDSARRAYREQFARMRFDDPDADPPTAARWQAWQHGRTGFPFVDAGMRQLRTEGWMHNRLRMVVASFLVKHLHIDWQHGARYFMHWLRDGDLASNSHGWQWTSGSGTDPAPYFRIFNPVTQGTRFDPDGAYVRRYVPELAHLHGAAAHTPWLAADGYAHGYPQRIIDLGEQRAEALARLAEIG